MNRNLLKTIVCCGAACLFSCTAPQKTETEKWSERMARSEMKRFPEPWMIEKAKKPRWGYTHGLVVKSMLEEWKHTGDSTYYGYAKIYADSLIDADGRIKTMKYLSFNIDNVNAGKILFDLYAQTGDRRYQDRDGYLAQTNGGTAPHERRGILAQTEISPPDVVGRDFHGFPVSGAIRSGFQRAGSV